MTTQTGATAKDRSDLMLSYLDRIIRDSSNMEDVFDNEHAAIGKYPSYLPSWDEYVADLMLWRDAIRAERIKRAHPVPTLTWLNEYGDDVRCSCGNTVMDSGFSPCDVRGALVEPTSEKWPLALVACLSCGAVFHEPNGYTKGAVIIGQYPETSAAQRIPQAIPVR